jgi:hypothetical protein
MIKSEKQTPQYKTFFLIKISLKIMNKGIKITIPIPCSQEWNNLTIAEQGRFCASCEKVVIDFRKMSDNELLDYFKNNQKKVCGHFSPIQMDRIITPVENKLNANKLYKFIASIIGLFLSLNVKAQTTDTIQRRPIIELNPLPTGNVRVSDAPKCTIDKPEQFLLGRIGGVCILPTVVDDKSKIALKNRVFNRIEDILQYF